MIESILDDLPIDRSAKADAWDAFHESQTPEDLQARLDALPLPHATKADLWDMKAKMYDGTPTPAPEPPPVEPEAAPEPPKPNQVQRVSPSTPNPPTAALPTQPEKPATIDIQMQQLGAGQRRVVMFPKGTPPPAQYPNGTAITHDPFGNTYAYRADLIRKSEIRHAATQNRLSELLGAAQGGMGAPDKTALQGKVNAVVARAADGTEAQSTATDDFSMPGAVEAAQKLTPPGGSVTIEQPQNVIHQRIAEAASNGRFKMARQLGRSANVPPNQAIRSGVAAARQANKVQSTQGRIR